VSNRVNHWHKQAQLLLNQKQFQQAHTACIEILKLVPQHADAHFLLGMIALNMQQMSKSIELIKKAITLQPSNAEYHAFLARCFSLVNRYKEARAEADLAIQYQSSSAIHWELFIAA
jgi:tetratricopeptide (TPR) repeat protein